MTDNARKLLDALSHEHRQEFDMLLAHDRRRGELAKAVNVYAARQDFARMNNAIALLHEYEDATLVRFCEDKARRETLSMSDVARETDASMNAEEKERFRVLCNLSLCYASLLDSACIDLTALLDRHGYAPKTTELFLEAGKRLKDLVRETFGNMPLEWADDFDEACTKADGLVKNKIRSFLRQQERKHRRKEKAQ